VSLRLPWLVCTLLLLGQVGAVWAADAVRLVSLEGRLEAASRLPAVFANHEEKLNLEVGAVPAQTASLRADFFQVAGGLAMPLAKNIHLQDGIAFTNVSPQSLRVSIKFPDVKRQAEILVRLALVQNVPKPVRMPLGELRFEVFPASVTRDLTDLLQPSPDGSPRVVVFGPGQKLRHFLTGLHVPFEDGGTDRPDRSDPDRLYFGELATDEQFQQAQDQSGAEDRSGIARMVLFSPDESLPPGVYSERFPSGAFIHVTSPLLDNLDDDPRAQLELIKIVHLLSSPYHPPRVE